MVTALIAAAGLMVCQEPTDFDGGVATIERGPQYIVGDTTLCARRTVLSPDASKPLDLTPLTEQSTVRPSLGSRVVEGGIVETTLIPDKPIARQNARQCKTTYRVKTLELLFPKGKTELTPDVRAQVTAVMAEGPVGLSLVGYVEEKAERRNSEETARSRMQAIRSHVEGLAVAVPSMSLEERPVPAKRLAQREGELIVIMAIFSNPCGERVPVSRGARTISR
jgi:hypothetical protein